MHCAVCACLECCEAFASSHSKDILVVTTVREVDRSNNLLLIPINIDCFREACAVSLIFLNNGFILRLIWSYWRLNTIVQCICIVSCIIRIYYCECTCESLASYSSIHRSCETSIIPATATFLSCCS